MRASGTSAKSDTLIKTLDWYSRVRDAGQIASFLSAPFGGLVGVVVNGFVGLLVGAVVGLVAAIVIVAVGKILDFALNRLWPLPRLIAETRPVQGEWGYGRSINGRLTAAFVMVAITGNNPGGRDERITNLRCDLYHRRVPLPPKRIETLPFEKDADWFLPANGAKETREMTFHKTLLDFDAGAKMPIGEKLTPRIVVEFGSARRTANIELPEILVKGPYPL